MDGARCIVKSLIQIASTELVAQRSCEQSSRNRLKKYLHKMAERMIVDNQEQNKKSSTPDEKSSWVLYSSDQLGMALLTSPLSKNKESFIKLNSYEFNNAYDNIRGQILNLEPYPTINKAYSMVFMLEA
ncbi:hypothetical protein G2W53_037053 [Senna tora]|uniref:Uncharacterized protein n=1 Tax=Senna tora TaxID=362788 RepID=A0A834STZ0_9FABA|nr:hypothetical protein G2W53_037053 [Senna tora]